MATPAQQYAMDLILIGMAASQGDVADKILMRIEPAFLADESTKYALKAIMDRDRYAMASFLKRLSVNLGDKELVCDAVLRTVLMNAEERHRQIADQAKANHDIETSQTKPANTTVKPPPKPEQG